MTKNEIKKYLSLKRTFTKKELIPILIISILLSTIEIILLILQEYYYLATISVVIYMFLVYCSIVKLAVWKKKSDIYLATVVVISYFYIVFSSFLYVFVYESITIYYYLLVVLVFSSIIMFMTFAYILHKLKNNKFPTKKQSNPSTAFLAGIISLFSVTIFRIPIFVSIYARTIFILVWLVVGSFLLINDCLKYFLSKQIDDITI